MKPVFSARRSKARRIHTDIPESEDDDGRSAHPSAAGAERPKARRASDYVPSAATSPHDTKKTPEPSVSPSVPEVLDASPALLANAPSAKSKKASKLRLSFGIEDDSDAESAPIFISKKSSLSRKAQERNTARKAGLAAGVVGMGSLSLTPGQDRVSYSKEYLDELKSAQVVVPISVKQDANDQPIIVSGEDVDEDSEADRDSVTVLCSKKQSEIPDEGLVHVMKQRRKERAAVARAGGNDFVSLNASDDDDESSELILRSKKKKESRLARSDGLADDDEIENYVNDDERLLLSTNKSLQREQDQRRKQGIRDAIEEAEGLLDSGDSDASRNSLVDDWERDQIRKGAFSSADIGPKGFEGDLEALAKRPPMITPLPNLINVLARLERKLKEIELRKAQIERRAEDVVQEKSEIRESETKVQEQLTKAAIEYEKLRKHSGLSVRPEGVVDRGLESYGSTPIRMDEGL